MAFGALSSGISALRSFSKGMEVIGNNIANVNTVSFKSSRIKYSETFNQVLQQSAPSPSDGKGSNVQASQVGLGVQVEGIVGQFHQGGLTSTNQLTDLAISGEGFFLVKDSRNNDAAFATRGGDFRIDDRGYLVTSSGMNVQGTFDGSIGFEVDVNADGDWTFVPNQDSQRGTITPSRVGAIQIDYNKHLAEVVDSSYDDPNRTRNAVMFTNNLVSRDGTADANPVWGSITFDGTNITDFVYGSSSLEQHRVGSFVFDNSDSPTEITGVTGWHAFMEQAVNDLVALRNKSDQGDRAGIVTDSQIREAVSSDFFYRMFGADLDAANIDGGGNFLGSLSSDGTGILAAWNTATGGSATAADLLDPTNADAAVAAWNAANPSDPKTKFDIFTSRGPMGIDGNAVERLFQDNPSITWPSTIDVDGTVGQIVGTYPEDFAAAEKLIQEVRADKTPDLSRFSIDSEGTIRYFLANGDSFIRGQIQLVDFNDKTALIREGQNLYSGFGAAGLKDETIENPDGLQVAGRNGLGLIKQGALELSNVDLTNEFAQMITTQRGFQAGSRIITVSDDILQEVVNLKR